MLPTPSNVQALLLEIAQRGLELQRLRGKLERKEIPWGWPEKWAFAREHLPWLVIALLALPLYLLYAALGCYRK